MRPQVMVVSSQAASAAIPMDYKQVPFNVGLALIFSGTATASVQATYDNVYENAAPTWFDVSGFAAVAATNTQGVLNIPVFALRLNVTAYTNGTVTLTAIQGNQK
jgi:hypothetical protein